MSRELFIHVARQLPKSKLHYYDKEVAGIYMVEVFDDPEDDDDMAAGNSAERREELAVTAALNEFHESVAIKVLDDFAIGVKDAAGNWVGEGDDAPDEDDLPSASLCGMVDGTPSDCFKEDVPPPPAAAVAKSRKASP